MSFGYRNFLLIAVLLSSPFCWSDSSPTVYFIPGAASSGDRIYLPRLTAALGWFGGDGYFDRMVRELEKKGIRSEVCPRTEDLDTRTLEERAEECIQQIVADQAGAPGGSCLSRQVMLVGHSMGGLVARLVANDPRARDCIRSVTTIATPHQGTPIADFAIDREDEGDGWAHPVRLIGFEPERVRYLPQLRVDRERYSRGTFAAQDTPDNPKVEYFSFSGSMKRIPLATLEIMRRLLADELVSRGLDKTEFGARNDGVVPEYSMVHGKYLGHIESHHFGTACIDPVQFTIHCRRSREAILPHLEGIYRSVRRSIRR